MVESTEAGREESVVYVVRAGAYSDTWTVGVFTNRDHADAVAIHNEGCVDEFQLDPPIGDAVRALRPGERGYHVLMRRDGQDATAWPIWRSLDPDMFLQANNAHHNVVGQCFARDEAHAIKIINDRRIAWLAAGSPVGRKRESGWFDALTPPSALPKPTPEDTKEEG